MTLWFAPAGEPHAWMECPASGPEGCALNEHAGRLNSAICARRPARRAPRRHAMRLAMSTGLEEDYQNEPIDFRKRSLNLVPPHAQLRRSSIEPRTPASPRSPPAAALTGNVRFAQKWGCLYPDERRHLPKILVLTGHLRRGSTGDAHTVKLATTPHAEASTPTCEPSEDEAASARGW